MAHRVSKLRWHNWAIFQLFFFSPWDRFKMAPSPCAILVYIVLGVILGHFDIIKSMANEILCAILSWHQNFRVFGSSLLFKNMRCK